jgi:hypothetical protein
LYGINSNAILFLVDDSRLVKSVYWIVLAEDMDQCHQVGYILTRNENLGSNRGKEFLDQLRGLF